MSAKPFVWAYSALLLSMMNVLGMGSQMHHRSLVICGKREESWGWWCVGRKRENLMGRVFFFDGKGMP